MRAIGLMSGTSMDGIDLAFIETDGAEVVRRLDGTNTAYDEKFRAALRTGCEVAKRIGDQGRRGDRPGGLATLEAELTRRHAGVVNEFMQRARLVRGDVDVIGFHGHTVLHRLVGEGGTDRLSVQIGDGALLAALTGIDVVYDLRAADTLAGGEGAPLVPVYVRALAARLPQRPLAFLNIGGVANLTWIGPDGQLVAFDTGPGNALIDDWVRAHGGCDYDKDGLIASRGTVDGDVLTELLANPYFARLAPKSLDRNDFSGTACAGLGLEDGAATLTAFTAETVLKASYLLAQPPEIWIVCGGGRRNRAIMCALAERLAAPVVPGEAFGFDGDTMEAEAFAYLAVRSLVGLPITFPGTTGVAREMTGGVLARAPTR